MNENILTIATRESPLAMWQAEHVQAELQKAHPELTVNLLPMTTRGDQILNSPLSKIGGKGLFIKELEHALLDGRADIAVHSMKDVPMEFPESLGLAVICEREDYHDAFVSNEHPTFQDLPEGAVVGSSSLRRQCQLRSIRPDIQIKDLRGNVNTRLRKLDEGQYDAIILASAGLKRLGMANRIKQSLASDVCLPAGGQGAVGIEARLNDPRVLALLMPLHHKESTICVSAERAMNAALNGGCQVPIACLAKLEENQLHMRGLVGDSEGKQILRAQISGFAEDAEALGVALAEDLLQQGAGTILAEITRV